MPSASPSLARKSPAHTSEQASPALQLYRADLSATSAVAALERVAQVGPISASMKAELLRAAAAVAVHPTLDRAVR